MLNLFAKWWIWILGFFKSIFRSLNQIFLLAQIKMIVTLKWSEWVNIDEFCFYFILIWFFIHIIHDNDKCVLYRTMKNYQTPNGIYFMSYEIIYYEIHAQSLHNTNMHTILHIYHLQIKRKNHVNDTYQTIKIMVKLIKDVR